MKKLILCFLLLIIALKPVKGDVTNASFYDGPKRFFKLTDPDYKSLFNPYQKRKPSALQEYMERPQFKYLMTEKIAMEYDRKLNLLLNNDRFLNRFNIQKRKTGYISKEIMEKTVFNMGQHYFDQWTTFKLGRPRINTGRSFFDTLYRMIFLKIPLISIPFKTPYRTIYDAEQSFRYYLKKYPNGLYSAPALFSIGRCRINQKDYLEATIAYKYALRVLMEQNGITNSTIADTYAPRIMHYAKEYQDGININIHILKDNSTGYIDSKFEFCQTNRSINISIGFSTSFGDTVTNSNP